VLISTKPTMVAAESATTATTGTITRRR
jgi:hypothetical protein